VNAKTIVSTAVQMYRSKGIRTWVLEGVCDKKFFLKWVDESKVRLDGFGGKPVVVEAFHLASRQPYDKYDFLSFFSDLDYDFLTGNAIKTADRFYYHALCICNGLPKYNDLECFLINSPAFIRFMAELDQSEAEALRWREMLESYSRVYGSFRAADMVIVRSNGLKQSVLDGLEVAPFFTLKGGVLIDDIESSMRRRSPRKEYVDDVLQYAEKLRKETPSWGLSRGHDVTELVSILAKEILSINLPRARVEQMLRLACEKNEFLSGPVGCRMQLSGDANNFKQ